MAIRRAGIWLNPNKSGVWEAARQLVAALTEAGITPCVGGEFDEMAGLKGVGRGYDGCQALITLGGDGTLLSGLSLALDMDVPMLGVNLGHMGFLTGAEPGQISEAVRRLAQGRYELEERMLLAVEGFSPLGLNDVTLTRSMASTRILTMSVYADGRLLQRFSGDGLVVSTPTGATGYSLSAGGPLVAPGVDLMLLTPICAHTPHAKPIVVSADARVRIELREDCEAVLAMDGRFLGTLPPGGGAMAYRAPRRARFIRLGEEDFFSRLQFKLMDWGQ